MTRITIQELFPIPESHENHSCVLENHLVIEKPYVPQWDRLNAVAKLLYQKKPLEEEQPSGNPRRVSVNIIRKPKVQNNDFQS